MVDASSRIVCEHSSDCPGCPLIGLSYGEQLEAKRRRVAACVEKFPEIARFEPSTAVGADPIVGYRQRVKLAVAGRAVGLYARGSHRVLDLPGCKIQDPLIFRVVGRVRELLSSTSRLVALDVVRASAGVLVTLVVDDEAVEADVLALAGELESMKPEVLGVAVSRRERGSPRLLGHAPKRVFGVERVEVRSQAGEPFHYVTYGAFAQAHAAEERALLEAVRSALAARIDLSHARILELFAGAGAFALALAARGARVHAVEAFAPAVELARAAARAQRLDSIFEAADADDVIRRFAAEGARFDAVVLNPPRRGLSPLVRRAMTELAPDVIVYVSCEPRTLARDLADLARRGFSPASLVPYDMMPLTEEVETLAVLSRAPPPSPEVIFSDERLVAVVKGPHEPTIPQGEHAGSLLERVRRLPSAEEAVPVHRLDLGTSGVCLFARRPENAAELANALALGEKEYVALVKGVARKKGVVNRHLVEHGRPREARTRYSRLDVVGGHSLVAVRPEHGRKHQVRRHLASIGHPIVGDDRYGDPKTNAHFSMKHGLDRPFLHARTVTLAFSGQKLVLAAPLAPDLVLVLESLTAARK